MYSVFKERMRLAIEDGKPVWMLGFAKENQANEVHKGFFANIFSSAARAHDPSFAIHGICPHDIKRRDLN